MRDKFNRAAKVQNQELIRTHGAIMYATQTLAERHLTKEEFLCYIEKVWDSVSDKVEWENVMRLREQLDDLGARYG